MVGKIKRIAGVGALSIIVFIATGVLAAFIAGLILDSSPDANGQEKLAGGAATTMVILLICTIATISFAVWLNRLLNSLRARKGEDV